MNYKQKIEHLSEMARRGTQVKFLLHERKKKKKKAGIADDFKVKDSVEAMSL